MIRYGAKRVLCVCVLLWSTMTMLTPGLAGQPDGVRMVVAGRIVLGLVEGMMYPCIYTYIARRVVEHQRGPALATIGA